MMDIHTQNGASNREAGSLLRVLLTTAMVFATMAVIPPSADALVRQRFGLDNQSVSLFYTLHSLPQLVMLGLLVGILSDRLRRRVPLIMAGTLGTAITTMMLPWAPDFSTLLLLRFVDGATGILALGLLMTRALDLTHHAGRPLLLAVYMAAIPIGYLTGSFLVAALGTEQIALTFLIVGGMLALSACSHAFDLRRVEPIGSQQSTLTSIISSLRRTPKLLWPCLFGFVDKFTFGLITLLTGLALKDEFGLSSVVWGGSALGMLWIGYLLASIPAGRLMARIGPWWCIALGSAGYGLCLIILLAFHSPGLFVVLLSIAGAFIALQTLPTYALVGTLAASQSRATAMAGFNLLGSFGMMLGFVFAGIASTRLGYLPSFVIAGAAELLTAFIAAMIAWRLFRLRPKITLPNIKPTQSLKGSLAK